MKQVFRLLFFLTICWNLAFAQTAIVKRNVNLRPDPSIDNDPVELLKPPATLTLLEPGKTSGFYHVSVPDGKKGFVWANNVTIPTGETGGGTATSGGTAGGGVPSPLTAEGHPVDSWFVFKFNSASFPGCAGNATPACPFGGSVNILILKSAVRVCKQRVKNASCGWWLPGRSWRPEHVIATRKNLASRRGEISRQKKA